MPSVLKMALIPAGGYCNYSPEEKKIRNRAREIVKDIAGEGTVLLKNEGLLPIKTNKINIFGAASTHIYYGGSGSGSIDVSFTAGLYYALSQENVQTNYELYCLNKNWTKSKKISSKPIAEEKVATTAKGRSIIKTLKEMYEKPYRDELPCEALTSSIMKSAVDFSEIALVVIARNGSEEHDLKPEDIALLEAEKSMIEKVCMNFSNVILLLNTANAFALDFLDDYPQIKSVLNVGFPGETGLVSVAKILTGKINPSGKLVDTFYKKVNDHPAVCNTGHFQYKDTKRHFVMYKEDIYVGYRFAETFLSESEYKSKIMFPFGYGLSYTNFEWSNFHIMASGESLVASITVQNAGQFAGKDIVQIYCNLPYSGEIEKPKKVLAAFAKTDLLEPGQKQTLTIDIKKRNYASYSTQLEAYIIEKGDYTFEASLNAHQGCLSVSLTESEDIVNPVDDVTGTQYKNLFKDVEGTFTKLSRKNERATMPVAPTEQEYLPSKEIIEYLMDKPVYEQGKVPSFGIDNGLKLKDLVGKGLKDPLWDRFVQQFTFKEMRKMVVYGGFQTIGISRLGIPKTECSDGPAGVHASNPRKYGVPMPSETVLACTWNTGLALKMGASIGRDAKIFDVHCWYGPAINTHRSPLGGRNFEYYSEDPLISGLFATAEIRGAQSEGLASTMKHFALNDQDMHRVCIHTWCSEQAMREIYLKPFETAIKEGKPLCVMSGLNNIGIKWCGESKALLTDLLRTEWGFEGIVMTDGSGMDYQRANTGLGAGTDLWLLIFNYAGSKYARQINELYKTNPSATITFLQRAVRNICYMVVNTYLFKDK